MPKLHLVLLSGICLCVCGTPVHSRSVTHPQDGACDGQCASSVASVGLTLSKNKKSEPSDAELVLNAGVAVGPHGRAEGIDPVMQTENGDSFDGISGPSEAGGEAWSHRGELKKVESASEVGRTEGLSDVASVQSAESESATEATSQLDMDLRILAPSTVIPQLSIAAREGKGRGGKERRRRPGEGDSHQGKDTDTRSPSSEPLNPAVHFNGLTSQSPSLPSASTLFTIWGSDGATVSPLSDPLLPEIGPNLMPKEDGPESLWTEAARPGGADTVVPLAQDEATEGTMSSEALPLIFEPFEDVTPEGAAAAAVVRLMPGSVQPPAAMATKGMHLSEADLDQLVTVETDSDGPSNAQPLLMPDWTSPWQTSGAELLDSISSAGPSVSQRHRGTESEDHSERVAVRKPHLKDHLPTTGSSLSSLQHAMTTVTMATRMPVHKSRSGLEEMESEEERDEDDNDDEENSEESVEDESDEDQTETPKTSSTSPPYSFIPPPPVWVQRNQGLMRGWVELIREKAGYVSGMLAPVGIGITGALLIVGALYSIRMIHRKRRNSFKHQRRKVRQPEQPRETSTSRQDQAMLLADSSEDEF